MPQTGHQRADASTDRRGEDRSGRLPRKVRRDAPVARHGHVPCSREEDMMEHDLFASTDGELRPLSLPDAEVYYASHLDIGHEPLPLMHKLIDEVPWRAENVVVWGKTFPQPRLIA